MLRDDRYSHCPHSLSTYPVRPGLGFGIHYANDARAARRPEGHQGCGCSGYADLLRARERRLARNFSALRKRQPFSSPHPVLSHGHSPVLSLSGAHSLAYSNKILKSASFMSTGLHVCWTQLLPSSAIALPISCPFSVSTKNLKVSGSSFMPTVTGT